MPTPASPAAATSVASSPPTAL